MSDQEDITGKALRANWPILVAFAVIITLGAEARLTLAGLLSWQKAINSTLSPEAISDYRVWQNDVNWRLQLLEAGNCTLQKTEK